jgi:hypothetical protein
MHDASLNLSKCPSPLRLAIQSKSIVVTGLALDAAVGTRCGRLSCQGYTNDLGRPLVATEHDSCAVNSLDPSGQKIIFKPTTPPELLYVRRGLVYRQFPPNSTKSATRSGTVSVIITLTVEPEGAADTDVALISLSKEPRLKAENNQADELPPVFTTYLTSTTTD